jgi:hypothetical protein
MMKLSKAQRESHRHAARELIERLERRLSDAQPAKARNPHDKLLVERIGACKQRLGHELRDRDLMTLNLELADIFYRSSNADKRKRSST